MTTTPLALRTVPDRERLNFLPQHFGQRAMMKVESRVYAYADQILDGYTGGLWQFVDAENGAGFMVPPFTQADKALPGKMRLRPSEFTAAEATLSAEAAGLALTVLAVNHEWHRDPNNRDLAKQWEKIMDVIYDHPEAQALLRVLD